MRIYPAIVIATASLLIAGCSESTSETDAQTDTDSDAAAADASAEGRAEEPELSPVEVGDSTPMAERVATIGLLNKRNNVSQDFELRPGEVIEQGQVIVRLQACERTAPYEFPQETGAFVQVDVLERGQDEHARVFSGWLFKENPSLNVVEHPVYDVWVKDCAMSFPGDE